MKKSLLLIITSFILLSCSKSDDDVTPQEDAFDQYIKDTPNGTWFIMKGPNSLDTLKSIGINIGSGQLLEQAFYRVVNVPTPRGAFNYRVSFPRTMIFEADETWYSRLKLSTVRLPLEETKYIKAPYAEVNFSSSSFFSSDNASGTVELKNNYERKEEKFELFGEVDITVKSRDNAVYELKGVFWKK